MWRTPPRRAFLFLSLVLLLQEHEHATGFAQDNGGSFFGFLPPFDGSRECSAAPSPPSLREH